MNIEKFHKQLLASDEFAEYSLRAGFFYSRLRSSRLYKSIHEVQLLTKAAASFPWGKLTHLGIDQEAWDVIEQRGINPHLVFCHPRVISDQPYLLLYYRTVSLVSQKGLTKIVGGNISAVEKGTAKVIDPKWIEQLAVVLNSIVSVFIKTAVTLNVSNLQDLQFVSLGASIQGSWNNQIGAAGEAAIRSLLIQHLENEILQVVWRTGPTSDFTPELLTRAIERNQEIKLIRLKNGFHLVFSSEPDVSLRDANDLPLLAIEVKAGFDSAGALERLGAAMKSFENDRNLNPRVKTVYVARCMTPELQKRISHGSPFDYTFGLSELMLAGKPRTTFANLIVRTMMGK
ncbi:MAG: XcyI family restriction endonuclease [Pirellulales bacterium]